MANFVTRKFKLVNCCHQYLVTNINVAGQFMFENVHDHHCIYSVIKLNFEYFQAGK